jgi:hypothetical protein
MKTLGGSGARVVDPALALVSVEQVLKGDAPKQITLVTYVDGFAVPAQRKLLVANARECPGGEAETSRCARGSRGLPQPIIRPSQLGSSVPNWTRLVRQIAPGQRRAVYRI